MCFSWRPFRCFYTGNKQGLSSSSSYANRLLDILFCEFIGEAERHDGGARGASLALHSGPVSVLSCGAELSG